MRGVWNITISGLTKLLAGMLIISMALLVLDVVWGVYTRQVIGQQASWTEELARFLLIWVSLLGGALAFQTKAHLGVDYFMGRLDANVAKKVAVLSLGLVLFFAVAIFLVGGGRVVYNSLLYNQVTPALGWKMGYVYSAIPIAGFFMLLFTVDNLCEVINTPADELRANKEPSPEDHSSEIDSAQEAS